MARKLAGCSYGTATWATNVVNENGQVIMSMLTASFGLGTMIEGLIKRCRVAGVAVWRVGANANPVSSLALHAEVFCGLHH